MVAPIRFDGLASGIDTSEIISQTLAAERQIRLLPLQRQEIAVTAKQAAWRDVRVGLAALESRLLDLKLPGTYDMKSAVSSGSEVVTATAKADAAAASYTVKVEQLASAAQMWSKKTAGEGQLNVSRGQALVNGVQVNFGKKETVAGLADKINAAMKEAKDLDADYKVTATVVDGRLVLKAAASGENSAIALGGDAAGQALWAELGLGGGEGAGPQTGYPTDPDQGYRMLGQNAIFYVDGLKVEHSSNKVEDVITGLTLELTGLSKKTEGSGWEGLEGTELTVAQDVDKALSAVKAFVDEYNRLWKANREKQTFDSDNKTGAVLFSDSTLMGIQNQLRRLVTSPAGSGGEYTILAQIGISTGKVGTGVSADGSLHLDETKLKEALLTDAAAVADLFIGDSGVAGKLDAYLKRTLSKDEGGLLTGKDEALNRQIKDLKKQTERVEERLLRKEETLRKQYVQMEKVMAQMQSQGNWLMTQMAAMMGTGNN